MLLIVAGTLRAQTDVTRFLGIPVDGSKTEMIRKLKEKGFRSTSFGGEMLEGEFNGASVYLSVVTNNDKVCRILVMDANSAGERDIQIRFNSLCRQFENNPKYISLEEDQTIPADEDISYEITVNDKRYEAAFYQKPEIEDDSSSAYMKSVWFMIASNFGEYRIFMFYDNEYNRANGEDL